MLDELAEARNFARTVRYSGDTLTADESIKIENTEIDAFYSLNSIQVSPLVTPLISKSIDKVIKRLQIPPSSVKAYAYASPEIQATCYAGNEADCVIRLSSGLIDILENKELEFVIGHEIGHFLYNHGLAVSLNNNESLEFSIKQRAQEISADRIGLLASESLDVSIRAMMKTISGLTTKYLKFDIAAFLSQLSNTAKYKSQISVNSSHPSMFLRCRALLWFSMSETFKSGEKNYQPNEIDRLNAKIQNDIDKYVDSIAYEKINDLKKDVEMWLSVSRIVEDDSFNSDEQLVFKEMFGQNDLEKLKSFLSSHDSSSAAKKSVAKKLEDSMKILYSTIPISFESEMELLEKKIITNFS
tara:strand:+ start:193 stop:1263 length:1071 start_codon:yes stop_codon:yes gene_type:complete